MRPITSVLPIFAVLPQNIVVFAIKRSLNGIYLVCVSCVLCVSYVRVWSQAVVHVDTSDPDDAAADEPSVDVQVDA